MEIKKHYAYFSAAIRDGAKLRPQGFDGFLVNGRSCAFGAGAESVFGRANDVFNEVYSLYPYLIKNGAVCPAGCGGDGYFGSVIFHLNDYHEWSRERIADWLYAEEEKLGFVTLLETEASPDLSLEIQPAEKHGAVCSN